VKLLRGSYLQMIVINLYEANADPKFITLLLVFQPATLPAHFVRRGSEARRAAMK
jgi:hypothetical protein